MTDQARLASISWRRVALRTLAVFTVALGCRWYLDQRPIGHYFKRFEYAILQQALRAEFAATRPLHGNDRHVVPVVVDISPIPVDRAQPTDRQMLEQLVDALKEMNAAAIGIDIDFSPDDQGRFMSAGDPQLFEKWVTFGNVRIGVFRREGDRPDRWLGNRAFRSLAAGVMLPQADPGYAYLFSSADIKQWPTLDNAADYLLQMPAALYDLSHPGQRAEIVQHPYIKRETVDERIRIGWYPVDYSFRELIRPIPYRQPGDLVQWAEQIEGRAVLIGDLRDAQDSRSIPGFDEPLSGVLIHAAALATLNRGLLRYIDHATSLAFEVVLLASVVMVIAAVQYVSGRIQILGRFEGEALEIVSSVCAAFVVVALSILFVGLTQFFWADFLWIAVALLLHPYISYAVGTVVTAMRRLLPVGTQA